MTAVPDLQGYDPRQIALGKHALASARAEGKRAICVTLGNPLVYHSDALTYDHMGIVRALRELCACALETGMEIWVIPCNDYTLTSGLFRLNEAVAMPNLGYAWNILRSAEWGQSPQSAIFSSMGSRLRHVFLEDGVPTADTDRIAWEHRPLGEGCADLRGAVLTLRQTGYRGSFSAPLDGEEALKAFLASVPAEAAVTDPAKQLFYSMPDFLPPKGHPRVYFQRKHIPGILENLKKPQNTKARDLLLEQVSADAPACTPDFSGLPLGLAESKAFYYALFGDKARGMEAVSIMRGFCEAADPARWDYNKNGETVYVLAAVYDWCHSLLDDATRQFFHDAILRHARYMEIGYPPVRQGAVAGHGPEAQLLRDLMAAGIALFDEYPNLYQNTAGRFFREFIQPRRFVYSMHCFHQGNEYAAYRLKWEMLCTWLFDRLDYPRIFGDDQHETLRHYLYVHRPDGVMLACGNCNNRHNRPGRFDPQLARTLFLGANYWGDGQLKAAALRMLEDDPVAPLQTNQTLTAVEFLLFNDPALEPAPLCTLPWAHMQPAPKGGLLIRTGWHDGIGSRDVLCELKINEYWFGGHQHLDAGAFQIYYRGLLATDDGYYQSWMEGHGDRENNGYTGYGSLHHYNYLRRTVAHNCMLVYDPNEQFRDDAFKVRVNDGGQRIPARGNEPPTLEKLLDPQNGYRTGAVIGCGVGQTHAWLSGDLTAAYSEKVTAYRRSFCFLRLQSVPAVLLVFDRVVSKDAAFRKTWLCHGLFEPELTANRAVFRDTRSIPGNGPYCGRYGGQLTVHTLLPAAAELSCVKGAVADGVDHFAKVGDGQRREGEGFRLEVSPSSAGEETLFLHALCIGDANAQTPTPRLLETETHVGVITEDRAVLFGKGSGSTALPQRIRLPGNRIYRLLILDLQPGTWMLGDQAVRVTDGAAEFSAGSGEHELRRAL